MSKQSKKVPYYIKRVGGYLYKIIPVIDTTGKVINSTITPFMVELRPRDIMQIIVGACILAVPVGFTEETWKLGESLGLWNIAALATISILSICTFVYFNFYRYHLKGHFFEYVKRVSAIYLLSLLVVGLLLTIINRCPWQEDTMLAVKRTIIVTFPASMSAAVSDSIK